MQLQNSGQIQPQTSLLEGARISYIKKMQPQISLRKAEGIFWIQIQPNNLNHRFALVILKASFGTLIKTRIAKQVDWETQVNFIIQVYQKSRGTISTVLKSLELPHHDIDLQAESQFPFSQCHKSLEDLIFIINTNSPLFRVFSLPEKLRENVDILISESGAYGFYFQHIEEQTYATYSYQYYGRETKSRIRLQIPRSRYHNKIEQLFDYAKSVNDNIELSIQVGETMSMYLDYQCKGHTALIRALKQIISKNFTIFRPIISRKKDAGVRQFKVDPRVIYQVMRWMKFMYSNKVKARQEISPKDLFSLKNQQGHIDAVEDAASSKQIRYTFDSFGYQKYNLRALSQITKQYAKSNIIWLRVHWDTGLRQFIEYLLLRWQDYKSEYSEVLVKFIYLLDYKSYEIKQKYQKLYPQSTQLIYNFLSKLKLRSIEQQIKFRTNPSNNNLEKQESDLIKAAFLKKVQQYLQISEHLVDQIIKYLIVVQNPSRKNEKFKLSISSSLLKDKPVNFSNLIASLEQFQAETSKWQDALHIVFKHANKGFIVSQSIPSPHEIKLIQQIATPEQNHKIFLQHKYFTNIENENLVRLDCLGCTKHFVYNMNITDKSVNKTNFIAFEKIEMLASMPEEILLCICSYLNSLEGGILLFGCQNRYLGTIVQGAQFTEKQKDHFRSIVKMYLQSFYPKVTNQNVIVNFVPVIANPYVVQPFQGKWRNYRGDHAFLKNKQYMRRKYYKGTYIMRIIVKPTETNHVFYFKHGQKYRLGYLNKDKPVQIKIAKLDKLIKKMNYWAYSNLTVFSKNLMKVPTILRHICENPESGIKVDRKPDKGVGSPGQGEGQNKQLKLASS